MNLLLIATTNPGKLLEMKAIFAQIALPGIHLISPLDMNRVLSVDESGSSYAENASIKALAYSRSFSMLTLADDSGLEVDLLDGRPGVQSARYTGRLDATDADRRAYLLQELQGRPRPWRARFCCVVALALPDGTVFTRQGECPGEIIPEERGSNGFGYDPIFQVSAAALVGLTMAELTLAQKNRISHRALALRAAVPILRELLKK